MKKSILLGLTLIATTASFAQETPKKESGAYLRLGVGYAFPHAGDTYIGTNSSTSSSASYDYQKGSYGAGFSGVLALGYKLNRNIALELGAGIGIAPKKMEETYNYIGGTTTTERYAKMPVYLMPAVVISTGNTLLEPYARVGLAINVAGKIVEEMNSTGELGGVSFAAAQTTEYKQRTGIGFQGALGLKYHLNDRVGLWIEAAGISQNIYVKSSEMTEATLNGTDILDTKTVVETQTNYEYNYSQTGVVVKTEPATQKAYSNAFSNFGINLGVSFQF